MVPLCLVALVWYSFFPLPERHFKVVLLSETAYRACPCLVCTSRENKHKAISHKKGRISSENLQKTRDWKQSFCFVHSPPYKDTSPNAYFLGKPNLASLQHPILLSLWQRYQSPASTSLRPDVHQWVSFASKVFQKFSLWNKGLILYEKSFFAISGNIST